MSATPIPLNLAVEDELSEAVIRRLLRHSKRHYAIGTVYGRNGFGYLRKTIAGWNRAARGIPFLVLTDLDTYPCPTALIEDWMPGHHPNLLLRIAVREVESWVLADSANISHFLRVNARAIPPNPDSLPDPKRALIETASRSRSRDIRDRIVPRRASTAKQGPDYNGCLIEFILEAWSVESAAGSSPSLARTVERLRSFTPSWH
jgi:hypothetical protein